MCFFYFRYSYVLRKTKKTQIGGPDAKIREIFAAGSGRRRRPFPSYDSTAEGLIKKMATSQTVNKKRKFVADGVFYAELNELLSRELAEEGYAGVEIRPMPAKTDIIIRATRTREVLGVQGRRIRELTSLVQKRFGFKEGAVELYADRVKDRHLCAMAQAESLRYKLLGGLAVRKACYGVVRFIMEHGARGVEVVVSGKLRAARAKSMAFKDGYMLKAGQPAQDFVDKAVRHVLMKQGVLGVKVLIMRPTRKDPKMVKVPQPDVIQIAEPNDRPLELPEGQQGFVQNTEDRPQPAAAPAHHQPRGEYRGDGGAHRGGDREQHPYRGGDRGEHRGGDRSEHRGGDRGEHRGGDRGEYRRPAGDRSERPPRNF